MYLVTFHPCWLSKAMLEFKTFQGFTDRFPNFKIPTDELILGHKSNTNLLNLWTIKTFSSSQKLIRLSISPTILMEFDVHIKQSFSKSVHADPAEVPLSQPGLRPEALLLSKDHDSKLFLGQLTDFYQETCDIKSRLTES